ncbi:MAG: glycosyltransferase [archaeon]
MKIIHSAPLDIEISPQLKYAGTERILLYLNQGLHEEGQTSVVAAPGNSNLGGYGSLFPTRLNHLWVAEGENRKMVRSQDAYEEHYQKVLDYAKTKEFNIIHDHPGQFMIASQTYLSQKEKFNIPIITTTHEPTLAQGVEKGRNPEERQRQRFETIRELQRKGFPIYFITLSQSHKREYEEVGLRVDAAIHNGIDTSILPLKKTKQDYLLWLGRICDYKGTDLAVQVAKRTGRPLIIAGELHDLFIPEYEKKIKPHLTQIIKGENAERERKSILERIVAGEDVVKEGEIKFIGPVNDKQKAILYQNAVALLQPNRWKEAFGLVPVEAMTTGTPAIVTNTGALPELIEDGKTGIIVNAFERGIINDEQIIQGTIAALDKISIIKPEDCRIHVENKFSKERMTKDYLEFYRGVA